MTLSALAPIYYDGREIVSEDGLYFLLFVCAVWFVVIWCIVPEDSDE